MSQLGTAKHKLIAAVTHPLPLFVRAVDASTCSIAFSRSCYIDIYRWNDGTTQTISTQNEELDDLVGLTFYNSLVLLNFVSVERDYWLTLLRQLNNMPQNEVNRDLQATPAGHAGT